MTISTNASTGTTNEFKTSLQLQTPKPTTASVTAGLRAAVHDEDPTGLLQQHEESDPNEARYWMSTYGLGTHHYQRAQRKYAHPRKLLLKPTAGTAIVQQVLFGPAITREHQTIAPLAVVGGPRVHLYGTNAVSSFSRHLSRHARNSASTNTDLAAAATTTQVAADRMVQTGGHLALTAAFRNDGRLLAVGTEAGELRVCDVTIRATLCTFETPSNKLPVRAVAWFRNGQNLLSGGDDGVLRVWNLSSGSMGGFGSGTDGGGATLELKGHGDAIRAAILWQAPKTKESEAATAAATAYNQLAFSGSYDHTVRVWNVKLDDDNDKDAAADAVELEDRCLAVLSHGAPVEALITMKSTDPDVPVWLLSAGGVTIKVWNPVTGECVCSVTTQHRKTITTLLAVVRRPSTPVETTNFGLKKVKEHTKGVAPMLRIVTGSLDGCIRIHQWSRRTGTLVHIHGIKVGDGAPITALTISENCDRLAIGTTLGMVLVRQRGPSIIQTKRKEAPRAGTYSFFTRGKNVALDPSTASANNDYLLGAGQQSNKKRKLRKYDQCLKQFRYGDALDEALETRMPQVVVAVLEELGKRRGLTISLSNRDEESLEPILAFLVRYVTRPRFTGVLIGIAHSIIDIYGGMAGQSETIDELFGKLKASIRGECQAQKSLLRLMGQLDAILVPDYVTANRIEEEDEA